MVPWDPGAGIHQFTATAFYEGLREGEKLPWAAWVRPLGNWLILVGAIFTAFLCLATILRRQWSDNERLSYPLVQLPVEMIREQPGHSFFSNPLTWIGFAIPTILFGINGLHSFNPALPQINVEFSINRYFTVRPWSEITFWVAYLSPGAIGFFYLLPVELLLSFWVFFILAKVQDLVFAALAFPPINSPHGSGNGYIDYQTAGGYFMLVAYLGVVAWPHLKGVLKRAVGRTGAGGQRGDDALPHRGVGADHLPPRRGDLAGALRDRRRLRHLLAAGLHLRRGHRDGARHGGGRAADDGGRLDAAGHQLAAHLPGRSGTRR